MNIIMRTILVTTLTCAASGAAFAGKPANPPLDSGRDVIADAAAVCAISTVADIVAACSIVSSSNGGLVTDNACGADEELILGDNGQVDYAGRNCGKNEVAVVRLASSAVLALDDLYTRDKEVQRAAAAGTLCTYEDKYNGLLAIGKLVAEAGVDLGADASNLADDLMGIVGYCDTL